MGSAGLQWDVNDTGTVSRMNQKTVFVGTGAQINGLSTTFAGQLVFCTSTGSGFLINEYYERNAANSAWVQVRRIEGQIISQANTPSDNDVVRYVNSNTRWEKGTLLKRRATFSATYFDSASSAAGTRLYLSPIGFSSNSGDGLNDSTTIANVSMPITAEAITVRRIRVNVLNDGVTGGGTYDVGLWNDTDSLTIHSIDGNADAGTHAVLDSGNISVSVTGGDEVAWYYEPATGTTGTAVKLAYLCEYEYDTVF